MRTQWMAGLAVLAMTYGCEASTATTSKVADTQSGDATQGDSAVADTSSGDASAADTSASDAAGDTASADVDQGTGPLKAQGSVKQVFVTHAMPSTALELRDSAGKVLATEASDYLGSLVFRKVAPGKGYRVYVKDVPSQYSGPVDVQDSAESQPPTSFYSKQQIHAGNGYITTRDGTTLAYFATLPGPEDQGPYPTVVNYSGYDPGRPGSKIVPADKESLCGAIPVLCNAPSDPSAMVSAVAGYATVSVNIRGTGCSGGAYDYFEELQLLDGYDVIETVAAQPWVAHHKVGMVGLSYPGITQLFVAKTKPPSLAAIAPFSVIGNTATTLVPGGILNNGFALNWIDHVYKKAAPYAQGWEQAKVDAGDMVCKENQLLHDQRVNNVEQAKDPKYYDASVITPLNPTAWADQIEVPVFLACSFQDEQTGPFFTTLLDKFKKAPSRRFTVYNGVHSDGFAPQVLAEWKAFLDIYVAQQVPTLPTFFNLLAPQMSEQIFDVALGMPKSRWDGVKTLQEAKQKWEGEPELRVLFEDGATDPIGGPHAHFEQSFAKWPLPDTQAQRWYFQADGSLQPAKPTVDFAASSFDLDPDAGQRGIGAKSLWSAKATYDWAVPAEGKQVAFTTAPLDADAVMVGSGSVDLWVQSLADDVTDADIEVNLSEVRPDGQERYVQSGWLRASFRQLTPESSELWPEPQLLFAAKKPMAKGTWEPMRVAIAGFAHVFRKGSRIRVTVDTPGDSRADWRFDLLQFPHPVSYHVAHDAQHPSSVALPLQPKVAVPGEATLPPCPSLRGQQCRSFVDTKNVLVK
ncbi:MAG: CocE/NonD family hydrolase [Deltaproteobacteria bacterium]|nr:CocE/NonD family hydrolase [Deltaproteobacteria bacterium]